MLSNALKSIFLLGLLTGCGSTITDNGNTAFENRNGTHYKIGEPYSIFGTLYTPEENYSYKEEGIASWYGPNFHAKTTANGGVFDQNLITAAHRELQIPSVVRVTNLENSLSIIVKVTDRGPYAKDRIIDLSHGAAMKLGFIKKGTALVRVEILEEESKALKLSMAKGHSEPELNHTVNRVDLTKLSENKKDFLEGTYVQAGAYREYNNAILVASQVKDLGTTELYKVIVNDNILYAVRIGPFSSAGTTKTVLTNVIERGFSAIIKII